VYYTIESLWNDTWKPQNCLREDDQITSKSLKTQLNNIQDNVCTVMELSSVNYFQHLVFKDSELLLCLQGESLYASSAEAKEPKRTIFYHCVKLCFFLCITVFEIPTKPTRLNNTFAIDVKEIQVGLQNV